MSLRARGYLALYNLSAEVRVYWLLIALSRLQDAVNLTPEGHPDRPQYLYRLSGVFIMGYWRLGDLKDLEAALRTAQAAVDLAPEAHSDSAHLVGGLVECLSERYARLGDINDLQAALQNSQKALDLTPEGHSDRAWRLRDLARCMGDRYRRFGDVKDLDSASWKLQEAVTLMPKGHPERAWGLEVLAESFSDRYWRFGNLTDLNVALQIFREVLDLTPRIHSLRARRLERLAKELMARYSKFNERADLEEALQKNQQAIELTPAGDPRKAGRLQDLAGCLIAQYHRFEDPHDLEAVYTHFSNSFKLSTITPRKSWYSSFVWASILATYRPSDCPAAYMAGFSLLPEILWIGHSMDVRHATIHTLDIGAATSTATRTCIEISNLTAAIQILEQGLATTFQQIMQLKTDVEGLPPNLADDFRRLSDELYCGMSTDWRDVANERKDILDNIRKQPGFEYFLLPKPYTVLRHASRGGPVIILNSNISGCDGILLPHPDSDPVHVPLPNVTLDLLQSHKATLKQQLDRCGVRTRSESASTRLFGRRENFESKTTQECFADILAWLWMHVVSPVYQALEAYEISNGRLWWLPTGAFTGLPLHAAPPTDEFLHSYTVTLGSLINSNAKKSQRNSLKVGVVGVTDTGSGRAHYLNGVQQEVDNIISIIGKPHVQCLAGEQATVDAIKQQLQECSWAHLACHGKQNLAEPTKSHLLLYGDSLKLETVLQMPLANAEFVFLAACQTAMGDSQLMNESLHLGGGFIAAGFRSAVGTQWSMDDQDGPLIAEVFYSHLFRDGRKPQASDTAEALHLAVKELKKRNVPYERWIPFIHMGV
ncbi:CHAT domain-containing protein [Mycena metata]|uniref:CHAT domain-containing protein n=1 Tax=Mycena metata TaxID=1033252 RepID=A0AAD7H063_9AGAR|nr:CHAT domain-containing protein [Mycena metata]